jgi:hypothetical protein
MMKEHPSLSADEICFGLNRKLDEQSLVLFLKLFSRDQLLDALAPRLEDFEIEQVVDLLSALMRKHLQEKEYHELFLDDHDHHH